jgi:glucose-1-phosphatase
MPASDPNLKNLIFDLGGVILDLSFQRTFDAFARLANIDAEAVANSYYGRPEFFAYEKGELTDEEFRAILRKLFAISASDAELDACWNAMLVDIPLNRIQLLEKLRGRFQIFLLSNTNSIHAKCFNQMIKNRTDYPSLERLFDKAYYSHEIKMRKPDPEIFECVLNDSNISAHDTLFLDDNLDNIQSAKRMGIKTIHVSHTDMLLTLFT